MHHADWHKTLYAGTLLAAAGLLGPLAAPLYAQDAPRAERPPQGFLVFDGPEGGAPRAAESADRTGDALPDTPPAPAVKTADEEAQEGAEISANYDATLDIYSAILDRHETDPSMLERRIRSNKEIVERYRPQLSQSEQELRRLQVTYMNRVLELKRQHDRGELSDDDFRRQVEADQDRYERRKARLAGDLDFYRGEIGDAGKRLDTLGREHAEVAREAEMRRQAEAQASGGKAKQADPAARAVEDVYGVLQDLAGFRIRLPVDGTEGLPRYDHLHGSE